MTPHPQVAAGHYAFARYLGRRRWASLWHQLDAVLQLGAREVVEIGPGPGVFQAVATALGLSVRTVDIDPALRPDIVAPATALPLPDRTCDVSCAFQMLEHLPYEASLRAFGELVRVARTHVVISLPDARRGWHLAFHLPRRGPVDLIVPRPSFGLRPHVFDGEHHWEVNTREHPLARVVHDLGTMATLRRTWRVPELPYHRFFVFECR